MAQRRGDLKTSRHPQAGEFTLSFEVLHLSQDGQRMTIYQAAPGTPDHDALKLLALAADQDAHATR